MEPLSREPVRLLFVDDEQGILCTLPVILRRHGYEVTAVGSVNEALLQITSTPYDVLISDLNIGEAGDGFTVVSAMRRTQPNCVTIILTGYPGFESALDAIRRQVDDYLIKPAPIPDLVKLIEEKLEQRAPVHPNRLKSIAQIVRENTFEITKLALNEMKSDTVLGALPLTDEQRIEDTPRVLEELASMLESHDGPDALRSANFAAERGRKRHRFGYTIPMLATHARLLERAIHEVIHKNLHSLNLSYFMFDLKRLDDALGIQLEHSLQAYLDAERSAPMRQDPGL